MRPPRHTILHTKDLWDRKRHEARPFVGGEFIVVDGPHCGLRVTVGEGAMTVGRTEDNHIALTRDLGVSRRHAVVEWIDDRLYIRDLSSTNGTFVNGSLAQGRVTLAHLDVVAMGRSVLQIVFSERSDDTVYELEEREETPQGESG